MNDARVKSFRTSLESLLLAVDAKMRVGRWDVANEAVPEPLTRLASELELHLGAARKLAAATFNNSNAEAKKVEAMRAATERLVSAYEDYVGKTRSTDEQRRADMILEEELGEIRSQSEAW